MSALLDKNHITQDFEIWYDKLLNFIMKVSKKNIKIIVIIIGLLLLLLMIYKY
jgi:hypothetical protein